jgi:hypothetical protein
MYPSSTSSSNTQTVRAFGKHLLLFFTPLLAAVCLFEWALWRSGESWSSSYVARTQVELGNAPSLYSRLLFSEQFPLYKHEMTKQKRPKILILGTSRVMQVRDFVFHPLETSFYNAGGMIQSVYDMELYAQWIQNGVVPKPAVMIIGIDPWWIKRGRKRHNSRLTERDETSFLAGHVEAARRFIRIRTFPWDTILSGAPRLSPSYGYYAIGAGALYYEGGFRGDGSLQLEPKIILESIQDPRHKRRRRPTIIDRIQRQIWEFQPPTSSDPSRLAVFIAAVSRLKALGIEVYVFLPPFSDEATAVWEKLAVWSDLWHTYQYDLPAQLRQAGIFCLPLAIPTQDGFDDTYMYDGYHPSEIYAASIAKHILHHVPPRSFLKQVDLGHLDALLSRPHVSPLAFEFPIERFQ